MSRSIAIVIESLGSGGAQHVAATLANAWADAGIAVTVITFQGQETDFFKLDHRINRLIIGGARRAAGLWSAISSNVGRILKLRGALKRSAATIALGFIGSTNILTVIAAAGLGMRVIIAERNDPRRQSLGWTWDRLREQLYRFADLVVVNSTGALDALRSRVAPERLIWLPNPLRRPVAAQPSAGPASSGYFLAVGRLHPQKAYDVLLRAFAEVVREMPKQQLIILGDGPLRSALERQAEELKLSGQVQFAGAVEDPFPWYRSAQALVHPARYEGLPNAVLEAMSEGLPVIVSDTQTGLKEIVRHGESGVVVPNEAAHDLSNAMISLEKNPDFRRRLGAAARDAVAPFQPEHAVPAWSRAVFGEQSPC